MFVLHGPPAPPLSTFTLFQTAERFFLVGSDKMRTRFRILKIERNDQHSLQLADDGHDYTEPEVNGLLRMIKDSSKTGIAKVCAARGLLGFVKFLEGYYIILVTKRRKVGEIRGHGVYTIESTAMMPFAAKASTRVDENRYKALFCAMDMTKGFYFSYTYDLTHTLQSNMGGLPHKAKGRDAPAWVAQSLNEMYTWNHYLLMEVLQHDSLVEWGLPVIHGFFMQHRLSIFGRCVSISLLSRRSRYFAGTRYRKRGVNFKGYVANEVEVEQIVEDDIPMGRGGCPISSFTQLRGSIPLFWTQITDAMVPKPAITLHRFDPMYTATRAHVAQLFERYATPAIFLNLVKGEEKKPRESVLRNELDMALAMINSRIPMERRVVHRMWDFHKAQKSGVMMAELGFIAAEGLAQTGIFFSHKHTSGVEEDQDDKQLGGVVHPVGREQRGIIRSNCIDCLDRTNVAQYAMGRYALGQQLHEMGLLESGELDRECELGQVLMSAYEQMGDQIALQYVGSVAHAKMEKDKNAGGSSKMKKIMVTLNRYYKNTFTDAEKQNSIDLFLGNFIPNPGRLQLWDMDATDADYYLHNAELTPLLSQLAFIGDDQWWLRAVDLYEGRHQPPPAFAQYDSAGPAVDLRLAYWRRRRDLHFPLVEDAKSRACSTGDAAAAQVLMIASGAAVVETDDDSGGGGGGGVAQKEGNDNNNGDENDVVDDEDAAAASQETATVVASIADKGGDGYDDQGAHHLHRITSFDKYLTPAFRRAMPISAYADSTEAAPSRMRLLRPRLAWNTFKRTLFNKPQMPRHRDATWYHERNHFDSRYTFVSTPHSETAAAESVMRRYLSMSGLVDRDDEAPPAEMSKYLAIDSVHDPLPNESARIYSAAVNCDFDTSEETIHKMGAYMNLSELTTYPVQATQTHFQAIQRASSFQVLGAEISPSIAMTY